MRALCSCRASAPRPAAAEPKFHTMRSRAPVAEATANYSSAQGARAPPAAAERRPGHSRQPSAGAMEATNMTVRCLMPASGSVIMNIMCFAIFLVIHITMICVYVYVYIHIIYVWYIYMDIYI